MEETVNKLAFECKSTVDAVNKISKAWKVHKLKTVIYSRIEERKKTQTSLEEEHTEVSKSK